MQKKVDKQRKILVKKKKQLSFRSAVTSENPVVDVVVERLLYSLSMNTALVFIALTQISLRLRNVCQEQSRQKKVTRRNPFFHGRFCCTMNTPFNFHSRR